ncbi:hypothetical protein [Streptomyces sp. NPDC020880]|uniref:hypothetical protein n=1 Tax=Streptomyces sp. NPDC020880 TaxID=3365098 RepID=UPI0038509FBD
MLALLAVAWLVRDLRAADGPGPVWEYWSGTADLRQARRTTTSTTTLILLVAYVVAAVAALRSAAAASVLIVTGIVTLAVRLPGIWTIADASAPEELRDRALLSVYAALAAGIGLIVAGAAGRRPLPPGAPRPGGPGRGAGVAAFLFLGFQAVVFAAWEIRQPFVYPSELYPAWFIGGKPLNVPLTEAPPGWVNVVIILMFLAAAVGAVAGAAHARPLGLLAGGFALSSGVLGVARIIHFELYREFPDLGIEMQLNLLSFVTSLLAGAAVLVVLARKGVERAPTGGAPGPWDGWGAPAPGFGPPQGGGFGPPPSAPPPSSPPLR